MHKSTFKLDRTNNKINAFFHVKTHILKRIDGDHLLLFLCVEHTPVNMYINAPAFYNKIDKTGKQSKSKLENIGFIALVLFTGAKQGTSYERLIEETGFQTLKNRRNMRKLLTFHKLVHTKNPVYLSK